MGAGESLSSSGKGLSSSGESSSIELLALGQVFVITGSLHNFENRQALVNIIEDMGGTVASSVSSKTNYLINNDSQSSSSKNKKAKELGIEIITENEFCERFGVK